MKLFENFKWDSEDQQKGFFALVQYIREKIPGIREGSEIYSHFLLPVCCAFFIQKDHESNEWWLETVGNQIKLLQEEILILRNELEDLKDSLRPMP